MDHPHRKEAEDHASAAKPVLAWHRSHASSVAMMREALTVLLESLTAGRIETLRGGRAFRLLVEYAEDESRTCRSMRPHGRFILSGRACMLRVDMRSWHQPAEQAPMVRIDEPCAHGRRVNPDVESLKARATSLIEAIDRAKPDPSARIAAMAEIETLLHASYLHHAGSGFAGTPFIRLPGHWESSPYMSAITRGFGHEVPHFMFHGDRSGTVHPDVMRMIEAIPGPHGNLSVKSKRTRTRREAYEFVVHPDTHITVASAMDPVTMMRTLSRWDPDDGRPPLIPMEPHVPNAPRSRKSKKD